ncbi:MAG: sulfonate transport system substrate-binding protein [Alphaproteobacteria bacterium]|nr:sulfonate transport system substrate-binding protein [Alphaproteobacteria bacterium]
MTSMLARLLAVLLAAVWLAAPAVAEVNQVRFARQLGLGYLQFYIMEDRKLVEKHARELGLGNVTTQWLPLGTPTAISDTLLTGNADFIGVGLPPFLTLWDKTRGAMNVMGVVALNRQPAFLNTRVANIRTLRDFTDNDRIAVPAPKVSVQAIMLQMLAEKTFGPGKFDALDRLTVGMSHPDGTAALLSGKLEISAHFTSAPFQYQQLEKPTIHKVATSYDATEGPNTFSVAATTGRFRETNPKIYQAVFAALAAANDFIAKNPRETAEIFLRIENAKLPVDFIEKLITDPEFSFAPAPENVMKIYDFMRRVGALKNKPATWRDLFLPDIHGLEGS